MTHGLLTRPMSSPVAPAWSGAVWVGELDAAEVAYTPLDRFRLVDHEGYATARFLLRRRHTVLGFVEAPVVGGTVDVAVLREGLRALPRVEDVAEPTRLSRVTVVICTRDRPDDLRSALTSVLALDHPSFDVVVVDNASRTDDTRRLVETEFDDARVTLVAEPRPGISNARNAALRHVTGDLVAFTDDDVVVDRWWLRRLEAGFALAPDVALVSGLVPSGELRTPVQRYFDDRVSWAGNVRTAVYRLAEQPRDLPMFPFSVGEFGTGANFALTRAAARELGGFDRALGVGTPTNGGEDLDVFARTLFAGHALVVEPSALVWHRHRSDVAALRKQSVGYGTGLGAWLTKVAADGPMRRKAATRAPRALVRLLSKGGGGLAQPDVAVSAGETATPEAVARARAEAVAAAELAREVSRIGWLELASVLRGPGLYRRELRAVARREADEAAADDHDGGPAAEARGPRTTAASSAPATATATATATVRSEADVRRLAARAAVLSGAAALVAAPGLLPSWLQLPLVAAAVLIGPGAVLASWLRLRRSAAAVVVPVTGLSLIVLLTTAAATAGLWSPRLVLAGLGVALVVAGALRLARLSAGSGRRVARVVGGTAS